MSWLGTTVIVAGVIVLAAGSFLWFGQRKLIYFPDPTDPGSAAQVFPTRSDITLTTTDGLKLSAWRVDATDSNEMAVR